MYSIYKIYQSENLVYTTYHTMNHQYSDTTKLDIIINSPITPYYLVDAYFKNSAQFSIKLYKDGISNALDASQLLLQVSIDTSNTVIDTAIKKSEQTIKPKKARTKKAQQPKL